MLEKSILILFSVIVDPTLRPTAPGNSRDHYEAFKAGERTMAEVNNRYREVKSMPDVWTASMCEVIESTDY